MSSLSHTKLALVFLALQMLVIVRNLQLDLFSFYWYCDFVPILLFFAFLTHNIQAIKGMLNVGLFAQIGYSVIVLFKVFFNITLFGFVIDFPLTAQYIIPTLLIHTATIIAFIVTYKVKPSRSALMYSLILLTGIYIVVMIFAEPDGSALRNYNFIFQSNLFSQLPYYTALWVILSFSLVAVPTQLFQYLIYKIYENKKMRTICTRAMG